MNLCASPNQPNKQMIYPKWEWDSEKSGNCRNKHGKSLSLLTAEEEKNRAQRHPSWAWAQLPFPDTKSKSKMSLFSLSRWRWMAHFSASHRHTDADTINNSNSSRNSFFDKIKSIWIPTANSENSSLQAILPNWFITYIDGIFLSVIVLLFECVSLYRMIDFALASVFPYLFWIDLNAQANSIDQCHFVHSMRWCIILSKWFDISFHVYNFRPVLFDCNAIINFCTSFSVSFIG